jgi:hypothetical protein
MPVKTSRADNTANLNRLVALFGRLDERRGRTAAVEKALAPLRGPGGLVVEGEIRYAEQLTTTFEQARALFAELVADPGALTAEKLNALDATLDAPIWEVTEQVCDGLARKAERRDTVTKRYDDLLRQARSRQTLAREAIERAREVRAPLVREVSWLRGAESLLAQAFGALENRQLVRVVQPLARLQEEERIETDLLGKVNGKYDLARPLSRQLELLIMKSARDAQGRLRYTVLLRTPSEPGTHGVNIQGTSTIVHQDRTRISEAIARLARGVGAQVVPIEDAGGATRSMLPVPRVAPGPAEADVDGLLRDLGELMYRLLLPDAMQRYLEDDAASVTITTNDLELPWELMYLDGYLCLKRPVTRMPLGNAFPRGERAPTPMRAKIKFALIYSDPTGNLPGARREVEQIRDNLASLGDQIEVTVLAADTAGGLDLNDALRNGSYDVIHYAGHAWFDEEDPDLSGLVLAEGEVFYAQKIRRLNEGRPLVFLNACSSARIRNEVAGGVYDQLPAEGLASAFIYGGALACIGSIWPVPDRQAAQLATAFYRNVLDGHMIGEALRMARADLFRQNPRDPTWAGFVLYGNPTFTLVE